MKRYTCSECGNHGFFKISSVTDMVRCSKCCHESLFIIPEDFLTFAAWENAPFELMKYFPFIQSLFAFGQFWTGYEIIAELGRCFDIEAYEATTIFRLWHEYKWW